jgi:hypothetical protein
MRRRFTLLFILLFSCRLGVATPAPAPATSVAGVNVTAQPAKVTTRTFDPRHPPRGMPPLRGSEAAVTESKYACQVQIGVEVTQSGDEKPQMKITDVTAELRLEVVIWLPTNASAKIRAHENAHREIAEMFYKNAEPIAAKVAQKYIGKQLKIDSVDQNHTRPVIQRAANEFCGEYLGETEVRSEKVQKRFDEITDHGRNRVEEKEGIKRAMRGG